MFKSIGKHRKPRRRRTQGAVLQAVALAVFLPYLVSGGR